MVEDSDGSTLDYAQAFMDIGEETGVSPYHLASRAVSYTHLITINPRRYGQARRVIDGMDRAYREHLVLSNY